VKGGSTISTGFLPVKGPVKGKQCDGGYGQTHHAYVMDMSFFLNEFASIKKYLDP
jgi:hypothetical protein